jgi:hypothetical protein
LAAATAAARRRLDRTSAPASTSAQQSIHMASVLLDGVGSIFGLSQKAEEQTRLMAGHYFPSSRIIMLMLALTLSITNESIKNCFY